MTEHTPLPWRRGQDGNPRIYAADGMGGQSGPVADVLHRMTPEERAANAAYIVKACNAYPDLIFALKEIRAVIKETADSDSDELLLMLDGIARDGLAGNVLTSPQESGSSRSAVSDGVDP